MVHKIGKKYGLTFVPGENTREQEIETEDQDNNKVNHVTVFCLRSRKQRGQLIGSRPLVGLY